MTAASTAEVVGPDEPGIARAAEVVRAGGLVITPTATNYNLVGDATNGATVERIFDIKRRQKLGPLPVSLPHPEQIPDFVHIPSWFPPGAFSALLPGEVSFIFWQRHPFPERLTCGLRTVAVSVTSDPVFRALVIAVGRPLAATSANLSGQGNIYVDLAKAIDDLGNVVDLIVDGGPTPAASAPEHPNRVNTIVDLTFERPYLCRPGWVPTEILLEWFPDLVDDPPVYQRMLGERARRPRDHPDHAA